MVGPTSPNGSSTAEVVSAQQQRCRPLVGVISDADLMRREELGSEKTRPWWLKALTPCATLAKEFTKSHGKRVEELMSSQVISANEDASLGEIAALLEKHRIERVPILTGGKLVGILRVP